MERLLNLITRNWQTTGKHYSCLGRQDGVRRVIYILPKTLLSYMNFYPLSMYYVYEKVTLIIYSHVKALGFFFFEIWETRKGFEAGQWCG